ncbi:MAG: mechanosensitive ion channel [Candidatus Obscuribacterales bacterium]|nr:mechanosensitive ion channel [Candidatus Obscuribacterales bacterium]
MNNPFLDTLYRLLMTPVLPIGKTVITVWMLVYVAILLVLLIVATRTVRDRIVYPTLAKSSLDAGAQNSIGLVLHYITVGIGAMIILNTAGIETTALTVAAGAVGLGLSLGLQTVAKNFVGGVILLFERPIRPGDRIQIAGVTGDVTKIALRSTTVKTGEQTEVVIPNGDFMNEKITNWTGRLAVVSVPISVPAELEQESVSKLLMDVAAANAKVVAEPPPQVWLDSFNDKSLNYVLRATTADLAAANGILKSELNVEIYRLLRHQIQTVKNKESLASQEIRLTLEKPPAKA